MLDFSPEAHFHYHAASKSAEKPVKPSVGIFYKGKNAKISDNIIVGRDIGILIEGDDNVASGNCIS